MSVSASISPAQLVTILDQHNITRFSFIYDEKVKKVVASHTVLEPLADFINTDKRDFDHHEGIFLQVGPQSRVLQSAFVHRTCRGAAAGGVRNMHYDSLEDLFRDGMRLSRGMTHKNALAGIWWGGGKGVMARNTGSGLGANSTADARRIVYEEYGTLMSSLNGCYITAEDAGTSVEDMSAVFSQTRFTTCIPSSLGGSGNPSVPTARGVVRGMEAALAFLGKGTLEGKTVAVQGCGHVGKPLIGFLLQKGVSKIIGSDIDASMQQDLESSFGDSGKFSFVLKPRGDNSILFEDVDIVSPCAVGGILNPSTIPQIKAPIICGAANNQLADLTADDKIIHERNIVYIPDFLVNRMGIVNCADEQYGYVTGDELFERHLGDSWDNSIYNLSLNVLTTAKKENKTTQHISLKLAEERSLQEHPIWGHRGKKIVASLNASGWHKN